MALMYRAQKKAQNVKLQMQDWYKDASVIYVVDN